MLGPSETATAADWGSPTPHHLHHGFYSPTAAAESKQSAMLGSGGPCMYPKSALVWSPVAAAATAGCHSTALPQPGRPHSVSPASPATPAVTSMASNSGVTGLPWMSVMTDPHHHHHPLSMSSAATHPNFNMWNGGVDIKPCLADLNTKMNTPPDHHNRSPLQKNVYQDGQDKQRDFSYPQGGNLDERSGPSGGLDASQLHNIYGNHGHRNHSTSSNSPPISASSGIPSSSIIASTSSTIVVPQPVNIKPTLSTPTSATISAVAAAAAAAANGTGRKYQCKMCPQIFGSKADLQLHTQVHMREAKPYKCSQCSKAFANSSYLSQHTRIHLGIKPYRCDICQRKFTQLSHLQQHIRTHTGDKPYKCRHPGCNKAFSQLSNLQSHSRCHQTDKPYKCNSCYKCFADEPSLLEHIPKHKESKHLKTHICQFCGKSYTQETYLAKHLQKHAEKMEKRAAQVAASHPMLSPNAASRVAQAPPDSYWPKTSESMMNNHAPHHARPAHESSCLQGSIADQHLRLHDSHRQASSDLSHTAPPAHIGTSSAYDTSSTTGLSIANSNNIKTSSAFTPIQTGMLPISSGSQLPMPGSSRSYFPYEPISFQKNSSSSQVEMKTTANSFPNQLISLHQIRNYATMPPSISSENAIGLKDKSQ